MVAQHDAEGFGGCTNIGECTAVCPKEIPLETISRLNRDLISALTHGGSHWPKAAPRREELEEEDRLRRHAGTSQRRDGQTVNTINSAAIEPTSAPP